MSLTDTPWNDERIAKLNVFICDRKMSASQATAAFREDGFVVSRNAVVGKMWRLGIHSTHTQSKRAPIAKVKVIPITLPRKIPKFKAEPLPPVDESANAPEPLRTSILDLTSMQCRWALDDKDQHGLAVFCGHFAADGRYCEHHHRVCNIPYQRRA